MALVKLTIEGYTEWAKNRVAQLSTEDTNDTTAKEIKRLEKWINKKHKSFN